MRNILGTDRAFVRVVTTTFGGMVVCGALGEFVYTVALDRISPVLRMIRQ